MNGQYSSRKVEECCRYDLRYRWLLEGCEPPDHCTLSRFRGEVLPGVSRGLFGQLIERLAELDELDWEHLFVDGSKLEAPANRYSFVWRKSVEKRFLKLRDKAAALLNAPVDSVSLNLVKQALSRQEGFARLREQPLQSITSPQGIRLRVNRSIMVEGAFGVIKEDWAFRRFLLRDKQKVQTELFLLAFAFDVRKLYARMAANRTGSQLFEVKTA